MSNKEKNVVISFGRSAAITQGHHNNFMFGKQLADKHDADYHIHLSQSFDNKKNPIPHDDKVRLAKEMMPHLKDHFHDDKDVKNIFDALKKYSGKPGTSKEAHVVVGADRHQEFSDLLHKYNGKDYHYAKVNVHSSGDRVEGVSGTDMRKAVADNDFEKFRKGIPVTGNDKHAREMFDIIKKNMSTEDKPKRTRKKALKEGFITFEDFLLEAEKRKVGQANNKFSIFPDLSTYHRNPNNARTHKDSDTSQPESQTNASQGMSNVSG